MTRARAGLAVWVPVLAVLLLGCGSSPPADSDGHAHGDHGEEAPSVSVPVSPTTPVPDAALPRVTGALGEEPRIVLPSSPPPGSFAKRVLIPGDGELVQPGDIVMANHIGVNWRTRETFEDTWANGIPFGFSLKPDEIQPGWIDGLVGVPAGSRVLLSLPPDRGFGGAGHPEDGIEPTDTVAYVIDVLGRHAPADTATGTVRPVPPDLAFVSSAPGSPPQLTPPIGAPPAQVRTHVLIEGDGEPVKPNALLVVHYLGATWRNGEVFSSTWGGDRNAPVPLRLGDVGLAPGAEQALVGLPVGSRVLVVVPPAQGFGANGQPEAGITPDDTLIYVVDILGQYGVPRLEPGAVEEEHDHDHAGEE